MMPTAWKTVRVFISSTFRDMQAERDHLVRFVFPRLREDLLRRRIHFVDVDLRWGVTSDQDSLAVCREVVDECRPRFVCLLGGRYGWMPPGSRQSITAEEIHYGVLDREAPPDHAFFYFRDPDATMEMQERTPGEFREPDGSENAQKLADLKRTIIDRGLSHFVYPASWDAGQRRLQGLTELGQRVYADLSRSIDAEFGVEPVGDLDEAAEENASMEAFVEERVQGFVLGSRAPAWREMVAHAEGTEDGAYLCLTGEAGSGKSALLGMFWQEYQRAHPADVVVAHFVGASGSSTNVRLTLRRLCREIYARCGLEQEKQERLSQIRPDDPDRAQLERSEIEQEFEIPDDPERLRQQFPRLLGHGAQKNHVVIVIDGVDQFDASPQFPSLSWLPHDVPDHARIVLATTPDSVAEMRRSRRSAIRELALQPLSAGDADLLITEFLDRYKKQLSDEQRAALRMKADAGTPLYLRAALEELRTLGSHEEITNRIRGVPERVPEVFSWILHRLEAEPGFRNRHGLTVGRALVRRFVSCLAASQHGLSHQELVALVDPGDPEGNVAALTQLLRPYLMWRGALVDFFHGHFRQAVADRYLAGATDRHDAHRLLAGHFRDRADPGHDLRWEGDGPRAFQELPFHLARCDGEALARLLFDLNWLQAKADRALVFDLVRDFDLARTRFDDQPVVLEQLGVVQAALRLASNPVHKDASQLRSQLWGRLSSAATDRVAGLLEQISTTGRAAWLKPENRNLPAAGSALVATLDVTKTGLGDARLSVSEAATQVFLAGSSRWDNTLTVWDPTTLGESWPPVPYRGPAALSSGCRGGVCALNDTGLWDLIRGRALMPQGDVKDAILRVAVNAGASTAVSVSQQRLAAWDLENGHELSSIPNDGTWGTDVIAVSPDGTLVLLGAPDSARSQEHWEIRGESPPPQAGRDEGLLKLWDLEARRELRVLSGHDARVQDAAFLPDGWTAVSAAGDATLRIWNLRTGEEQGALRGHTGPVNAVAVFPDGTSVVSGSDDTTVRVWDVATETLRYTLTGHTQAVRAVAVSTDGGFVVSHALDGSVRVWDLSRARTTRPAQGHCGPINACAVTGDGMYAVSASSDRTLKVWDLKHLDEVGSLSGHHGEVTSVCVGTDPLFLVSGSSDKTIVSWDSDSRKPDERIASPRSVECLSVSPDRRWIAASSGDDDVRVWDWQTSREFRVLLGHRGLVRSVAFSADSRRIATASDDKTVKLWDLDSGQVLQALQGHLEPVRAIALSRDGRLAVSASDDKTLKLWDLASGRAVHTLEGHGDAVIAVAISPDMNWAVSASRDRSLRVWDLDSARAVAAFTGEGVITCCAFGPDNRTVVAGEDSGRIHFLRIVPPVGSAAEGQPPGDPVERLVAGLLLVDSASRYRERVAASQRERGDDDDTTWDWLNCLGVTCEHVDQFAEAESCYRAALRGVGRTRTREEALESGCARNLAALLSSRGRGDEAQLLGASILLARLSGDADPDGWNQPWHDKSAYVKRLEALALTCMVRATASSEAGDPAMACHWARTARLLWNDLLLIDPGSSTWRRQEEEALRLMRFGAQWISGSIESVLTTVNDQGGVDLAISESASIVLEKRADLSSEVVGQYREWLTWTGLDVTSSAAHALTALLHHHSMTVGLHVAAVALLLEDITAGIIRPGDRTVKNTLYAVGVLARALRLPHRPAQASVESILNSTAPVIAHLRQERFVLVAATTPSHVVCVNGQESCRYTKGWLAGKLTGFVLADVPEGHGHGEWTPLSDALAWFVWG